MTSFGVSKLEKQAFEAGLLLRIKVGRPLNLWTLRLVVADSLETNKVRILGEMKAWAYRGVNGFQLDTMRVRRNAPQGIGHLVWAATMAWALEETPCKRARLLAIRDEEHQHECLVRYFLGRGFQSVREVGSAPMDLPLRMIWGGSGVLMTAECNEVFQRSFERWQTSHSFDLGKHSSSA